MPTYRSYPSTPYTGSLPSMTAMGPVDLLPSSTTAPHYANHLNRPYGRHLAGVGAAPVPQRYRSERTMPDGNMGKLGYNPMRRMLVGHIPPDTETELDQMAEFDDTQGNGVFDPFSTEANVYPDAGVFASNYALPGYLAREKSFAPSEVLDATTGRPVYYVPGGAVSTDSAAQIAFLERGAYQAPQPTIQAQEDFPTADESIVNVMVGRRPVGPGIDQAFAGYGYAAPRRAVGVAAEAATPSSTMPLLAVAAAAALVGYLVAQNKKPLRPNRSRGSRRSR